MRDARVSIRDALYEKPGPKTRRYIVVGTVLSLAALAALALILVISFRQAPGTPIVHEYHLLQMVPYLLVLIGGIAGIQVFVVLLIGIASGAVIMLGTGQTTLWDMLSSILPAFVLNSLVAS